MKYLEFWKALKLIIQLAETLQIKELDYLILGELKDWNNEHKESGLFKNLKIQTLNVCMIESRKMCSLILEDWKFINTKLNEIQKAKDILY